MFGVCWNCGEWALEKEVVECGDRAVAICPDCGHEHPFRYLPVLVVTGASGTGKSTILRELAREAIAGGDGGPSDRVLPLESDVLWTAGAGMELEEYVDLWLRVCLNLHQFGRSTLLFGAGTNPDNLEASTMRRYFPAIRYLALVTDDDVLAERLRSRPDWRESSSEEFVREHVSYNRALKDGEWGVKRGSYRTLDTTDLTVGESVRATREWATNAVEKYR